jgi:Pvc16 N-terminal domain
MSNASIIAAVTGALVNILTNRFSSDPSLSGVNVTSLPIDKTRAGVNVNSNQLNLYLYQTLPNAAWRNMDQPGVVRMGETGNPPLALNLHYLFTAFGVDNSEILSQRILGTAMSVLHERPLLDTSDLKNALPGVDPGDQIERVRFSPQPLSLEEISKLWTALQTQYRLSTTYLATVVLIDSQQPAKTPLPVLARGKGDLGVFSTTSPSPELSDVVPAGALPSVQLGTDVTLEGDNLVGSGITASFTNPLLAAPITIAPTTGSGGTLKVHLANAPEDPGALAKWVPGIYTVSLLVNRPPLPPWTSNEIAFELAPVISVSPASAAAGTVALTITCSPRIDPRQRVLLLVGGQQVVPQNLSNPADTTKPTSLTFQVPGMVASTAAYPVRLRVDGVDSMPFVATGSPPKFAFDPNQSVKVT